MRILLLFLDMIRPNLMQLAQGEVEETVLDQRLRELGGIFYKKAYIPAPDTPRGLAAIYTGHPPGVNGCDSRIKWPKYFLRSPHIFAQAKSAGLDIHGFAYTLKQKTGIFPADMSELGKVNHWFDFNEFLQLLPDKSDQLVFVDCSDFHTALDDEGYNSQGFSRGMDEVAYFFDWLFKVHPADSWDHIFIFSDHGFKFSVEIRNQSKMLLLNNDRINILLHHRQKGDQGLESSNRLTSGMDIHASILEYLQLDEPTQGVQGHLGVARDHRTLDHRPAGLGGAADPAPIGDAGVGGRTSDGGGRLDAIEVGIGSASAAGGISKCPS